VAVNPAGPHAGDIYVTTNPADGGEGSTGSLVVINPGNDVITATIPVGVDPTGVAVNAAGTTVYVANESGGTGTGSLSVINTSTNAVTDTINNIGAPEDVAVSSTGPDAGDIYVTTLIGDSPGSLLVIDPALLTVSNTINVGIVPVGVAVSPVTGDVYVTNEFSNTVSVIS
jgi:YVTN family beta-propeller protein